VSSANDGLIPIGSPLANVTAGCILKPLRWRVTATAPNPDITASAPTRPKRACQQWVRREKRIDMAVIVEVNRNESVGYFAESDTDVASSLDLCQMSAVHIDQREMLPSSVIAF